MPAKKKAKSQPANVELQKVVSAVRQLLSQSVPGCTENLNPWRIPTFDSNGPMCLLMATKNHVSLGLVRGTSLDDPEKLLEGTGKNIRHVKLGTVEDVKRPALKKLIVEAARLNKKEPDSNPMMRMRK